MILFHDTYDGISLWALHAGLSMDVGTGGALEAHVPPLFKDSGRVPLFM